MFWKKLAPILLVLVGFALIEGGLTADWSEARSMTGGRTFKSTPYKAPSSSYRSTPNQSYGNQNKGSFGRGLMGGLLGGALGGMLFGSMFGMGGSGMGILPLLLLAGGAWFIFKKMSQSGSRSGGPPFGGQSGGGAFRAGGPPPPPPGGMGGMGGSSGGSGFGGGGYGGYGGPATPDIGSNLQEDGITQIRRNDPGFDEKYFLEVASDVFFQVQAGWMRRDLSSYQHLLGSQLASEYARHFEEMKRKGEINKLESIAIRNVEIISAGSDGREDFVTVLFTANLLDYTVNDKNGELISGSMTNPVKFREEWTWARPVGTQDWKLEGIKE